MAQCKALRAFKSLWAFKAASQRFKRTIFYRTDLEPLDKGRLSLGDVGDAFRAKRGKNAGFTFLPAAQRIIPIN